MGTQRWLDVGSVWSTNSATQAAATCFKNEGSPGTRIDIAMCNCVAAQSLRSFEVVSGSKLRTHRPIVANLDLAACTKTISRVVRPRHFPVEELEPWPEEAEVVAAEMSTLMKEDAFRMAISQGDVESAWALWSGMAEHFLCNRCGLQKGGSSSRLPAYCGRGHGPKIVKGFAAGRGSNDTGDAQTAYQRMVVKLANRLLDLHLQLEGLQQSGPGALAESCRRLWAKIRRVGARILPGTEFASAWSSHTPPPAACCQQLADKVSAQIEGLSGEQRAGRTIRWQQWLQRAWISTPGQVYEWCRGQHNSSTLMVQAADGSLVADPMEIDEMVRQAWQPVMQMYVDKSQPSWEPFFERFGTYIRTSRMSSTELTGQRLQEQLKRMRSAQACGMEGWRVAELKALPLTLLDRLAEVMNLIEQEQAWPKALQRALVTLIPKGEGMGPLDLRPISVMSAVYRLWAATRLQEVKVWQERWADRGQHGYRPGHSTEDVYWTLSLQVENALLNWQPLYGMNVDFAKCFDRLPHAILLRLVDEMGMNGRISGALSSMYRHLRKQFRVGDSIGATFACTNGILQGCPLSVVLLNALVSVWASAVRSETEADPVAYADDAGATSGSRDALQQALNITGEYTALTGQQLNYKKSVWFSTAGGRMRPLMCQGRAITKANGAVRAVGAQVSLKKLRGNTGAKERVDKACVVAERARLLPLAFDARSSIVCAAVAASGLYACSVSRLSQNLVRKLRTAVVGAAWGTLLGRRCAEIVLTLLCPGHRADPNQAIACQCLTMLRRMLVARPELTEIVEACWSATQGRSDQTVPGPIGLVRAAAAKLGWEWVWPWAFRMACGRVVAYLETSVGEWEHIAREGARLAIWKEAAKKRKNLSGIEAGVDRAVTVSMTRSLGLTPYEKGCLRSILADCVWTEELAHKAAKTDPKMCSHCGEAVETLDHMWWACPAWNHVRQRHAAARGASQHELPPCLRLCGIMPDGFRPCSLELDGEVAEPEPADLTAVADAAVDASSELLPVCCGNGGYKEYMHNGFVVVFTDGAAKGNQHALIRQAGLGAYWGAAHPFNASQPLQGTAQTNQRAELAAALYVLQVEARPVEIRSDSRYVTDGINIHIHRWKAQGWHQRRREISNADLWQKIYGLMQERSAESVRVVKVKGHATVEDVEAGRSSPFDKHGNDAADTLAVAGALAHGVNAADRAGLQWRLAAGRDIQRMMVEIIVARNFARTGRAEWEGQSHNDSSSSSSSCSSSSSSCVSSSSYASPRQGRSRGRGRGRRCRGRAAPAAAE